MNQITLMGNIGKNVVVLPEEKPKTEITVEDF